MKKWKCKVNNTCTGTGLPNVQKCPGDVHWHGDKQITVLRTLNRRLRPTLHRGKAAWTWHRLDRQRQKDGVSNPNRNDDSIPKANGMVLVQQRPVQKQRADSDKRRGHSRTAICHECPSDVSVRQLHPTLDNSRLTTLTDSLMSRPTTPSDKSQLRGGTHGQRYVTLMRLTTPSVTLRQTTLCGYFVRHY